MVSFRLVRRCSLCPIGLEASRVLSENVLTLIKSQTKRSLFQTVPRLHFRRSIGSGLRSNPIEKERRPLTVPNQRLVTEPRQSLPCFRPRSACPVFVAVLLHYPRAWTRIHILLVRQYIWVPSPSPSPLPLPWSCEAIRWHCSVPHTLRPRQPVNNLLASRRCRLRGCQVPPLVPADHLLLARPTAAERKLSGNPEPETPPQRKKYLHSSLDNLRLPGATPFSPPITLLWCLSPLTPPPPPPSCPGLPRFAQSFEPRLA